jgi:hypothetical protein
MYSPKVQADLVRRLYVQRRRLKRPMTHLVNEAVERYLERLEQQPDPTPPPIPSEPPVENLLHRRREISVGE